MKNKRLAQWLQDHIEMLGSIEDEADNALHVALYEGIIDMALHGETRMVDSVLESAAAHAVAIGRSLTDLLGVPQRLRERTWQRIGEEVDPEPAFVMLSALDTIFVRVIRVTIDAYQEATQLAHAAKSTEISRLYAESEQKVMRYATEVSRANRELARLEQAKTDFISIAAHELKTPLTLIKGYVNILLDMELEEKAHSLTEGIQRGAERMNIIIENMLDLSAMDMQQLTLAFQRVHLHKTIGLVITHLKKGLKQRKQQIEMVDLEDLPVIEADTHRIYQIFRHLISNAIKYTPDGGQISVRGQVIEAPTSGQQQVEITIEDDGVGIAPEEIDKIFEKFYRASDSNLHSTGETKFMGAGPGLGLAIVKGLIEAHGGRIEVQSQGFDMKNRPGSIFLLTLPVKANPRPEVHIQWIEPELRPTGAETKAKPGSTDPQLKKESN